MSSQGHETCHKKVEMGERDCTTNASTGFLKKQQTLIHVNSELFQIGVELTAELQASCDTGHND